MDWSHVFAIVVAVVGGTWTLRSKLSDMVSEVQGLRAELGERMGKLEGRVVVLEEARKAARRGRR